jgi:hypothetical protein
MRHPVQAGWTRGLIQPCCHPDIPPPHTHTYTHHHHHHRRYTKGSSPKGRNVFLKNMEPFMKW